MCPPDLDATLAADARACGVSQNRGAIKALRIDQIRHRLRPVDLDIAELIREDRSTRRS